MREAGRLSSLLIAYAKQLNNRLPFDRREASPKPDQGEFVSVFDELTSEWGAIGDDDISIYIKKQLKRRHVFRVWKRGS